MWWSLSPRRWLDQLPPVERTSSMVSGSAEPLSTSSAARRARSIRLQVDVVVREPGPPAGRFQSSGVVDAVGMNGEVVGGRHLVAPHDTNVVAAEGNQRGMSSLSTLTGLSGNAVPQLASLQAGLQTEALTQTFPPCTHVAQS